MNTSREDVIINHILQDTDHLKVAYDIVEQFPFARHTLILRELGKLEEKLRAQSYGERLEFCNNFKGSSWDKWCSFDVSHKDWPRSLKLRLHAEDKDAVNMCIGVEATN